MLPESGVPLRSRFDRRDTVAKVFLNLTYVDSEAWNSIVCLDTVSEPFLPVSSKPGLLQLRSFGFFLVGWVDGPRQ